MALRSHAPNVFTTGFPKYGALGFELEGSPDDLYDSSEPWVEWAGRQMTPWRILLMGGVGFNDLGNRHLDA